MMEFSPRQRRILALLIERGAMRSSDTHAALAEEGEDDSLVTVKRELSGMARNGTLDVSGSGPATTYEPAALGRLFTLVDADQHVSAEPDRRVGLSGYNFELFGAIPDEVFSEEELAKLEAATREYERRTENVPPAIQKKELERLVIELSWKSSRIEGNTYTLLETEKLIREHEPARGHDPAEATMILNHKDAFTFIHDNAEQFTALTRANLEEVHKLLVKDLDVGYGVRSHPVGVLGSKYEPLDNAHQITEAVDALIETVARLDSVYAKAFIALLGISYIQPFEDGNKRTARLMADALLLARGYAPLSYRNVDEHEYRDATIVFYELNSLVPAKRMFIDQYDFSARNYAVA